MTLFSFIAVIRGGVNNQKLWQCSPFYAPLANGNLVLSIKRKLMKLDQVNLFQIAGRRKQANCPQLRYVLHSI